MLSVAQPHYFFHAQISCFDAPIAVMALLVALSYWKSLRSPRWGILCGVFYGLALATKHNAWLIPCFLLVHYLWMRRADVLRLRPPRVPLAFVSMATLGPIVLFALWPWLWHAPVARTREWLQRHVEHEHYNFEYLGQNWNLPPPPKQAGRWLLRATFPFVSTAFTVPVTTLALAAAGAVLLVRRRRKMEPTDEPALINPDPPEPGARASWLRPGADPGAARDPGASLDTDLRRGEALPACHALLGHGGRRGPGLGRAPGDVAGASFASSPGPARGPGHRAVPAGGGRDPALAP